MYDVRTDPRLASRAVGDGVADDSASVESALDQAYHAGGGIVYLPAGTYRIDGPALGWATLDIRANVLLRGDGSGRTIVQFGARFTPANPYTGEWFAMLHATGNNGIAGMTLQNMSTSPTPNNTVENGGDGTVHEGLVLSDVDFELGNGGPITLGNLDHSVVQNCRIACTSLANGPLDVKAAWTRFQSDAVYYRAGRVHLLWCSDVFVTGCLFQRDMDYATPSSIESGGVETSFSQRIVLYANGIVGAGPSSVRPDSEAVMSQVSVVDDLRYVGAVTSATPNTLTDSAAGWTSDRGRWQDPNYPGPNRMVVAITGGKGFGQWRFVTGVAGKKFGLSADWTVTPDATSTYAIQGLSAYQQFILANGIANATTGITLYDGGVDDAIVGNDLSDAGSIVMRASSLPVSDGKGSNRNSDVNWYNVAASNVLHDERSFRPAAVSVISVNTSDPAVCNSSLGNEVRENATFTGAGASPGPCEDAYNDGYFNLAPGFGGVLSPLLNVGSVFVANYAFDNPDRAFTQVGAALCAGFR